MKPTYSVHEVIDMLAEMYDAKAFYILTKLVLQEEANKYNEYELTILKVAFQYVLAHATYT